MKTAVSIPDALFRQAEALARRLGRSRSAIYREALAEYVARREPHAVTVALDGIADELAGHQDEWAAEAARSALERSEW
jgi:predicted transcriptional regulator